MKFIPQASPWIDDTEIAAVSKCVASTFLSEHKEAAKFVEGIKEQTGAKYCVLAPNGTIALALALKAMGIGLGDEVIIPTMTFMASATAVEMIGATPVFCDIDESCQINTISAASAITSKTKAIMPVHLWGFSANMDYVMKLAATYNLRIVEDTAQSLGTTWKGKACGTIGDAGTFSFFVDKVITTGEGGAVVTNDEEVYENMLYIRNVGRRDRGSFDHPRIGYNFRMTDMQCAIGNVQLAKLARVIERKREIYEMYSKAFDCYEDARLIEPIPGSGSVPFRGALLLDYNADELLQFLRDNEIQQRGFFKPLHLQAPFIPAYKSFPIAEKIWRRGVCLPTHLCLTDDDIYRIIDTVRRYCDAERYDGVV